MKTGFLPADDAQFRRTAGSLLSGLAVLYALTVLLSHSAAYIAVAGLGIFAVIFWWRTRGIVTALGELRIPLISLAAFLVWEVLSRLINHKPPTLAPLDDIPVLFASLLFYRLSFDPEQKKRAVRHALFALAAGAVLVVLLGILQQTAGLTYPFPKQPMREGKLYGFFRYYIQAGCTFSTLAIFFSSLALFWETTRTRRILLGIAAALMMAGTLMTFARTYFLSLLATLLMVCARKSLRTVALGAGLMAVVVTLVFVFFPLIRERAYSIADVRKHPSNVERLYFFRIARDMIADHPVAGVGQREWEHTAEAYSVPYTKEWTFSPALRAHAHNVYLTVAAETGLVGLALFLTFWLSVAVLLFRRPPGEKGGMSWSLSISTGFALMNLFLGGVFDESLRRPLSFLLIAFLLTLTLLGRDEPAEKQ
ncbi:MAG: hypothetical protein C0402_14455 [Thermodesulfovibrio sp.]|nr:hypothetical protein [Thermodesulfovibrio sp.]